MSDSGKGAAADMSGNIYLTGRASSTDLMTVMPYQGSSAGGHLVALLGTTNDVDVVVIGMGPAGESVAGQLAEAGLAQQSQVARHSRLRDRQHGGRSERRDPGHLHRAEQRSRRHQVHELYSPALL